MFKVIRKVLETKPHVLIKKGLFKVSKRIEWLEDKFFLFGNKSFLADQDKWTQIIGPEVYLSSSDISLCALKNEKKLLENGSYTFLNIEKFPVPRGVWNCDFISGYVWENKYFQNIETVKLGSHIDVKIPWELSRMQHLSVYLNSYIYTKDIKDLQAIMNQILDWRDKNPYKKSVNWTCSMEVGIRAINLIYIALVEPKILLKNEKFSEVFVQLLYEHGKYIYGNLERYDEYYNNHYLSDLLGLLWIGLFLQDKVLKKSKKECRKWVNFANRELVQELDKQVKEDGTDYESSTSYHRLVTEIYLLFVFINKIYGGYKIASSVIKKIEKMLYFLLEIRKPDGLLPTIGDNDDGRIIIFDNYHFWNRRSCDFILERRSQLLSGDLSKKKDSIPPVSVNSVSFDDGGYYLLRNKTVYCMIHCGALSMNGHGGHSHNDQLAVVVSIKGRDFLVDSGTGLYTRDVSVRNFFRSTAAHNTLEIMEEEQNNIIPENLFQLKEQTFSECIFFNDFKFVGRHFGYRDSGKIHRRNVEVNQKGLKILDYLDEIEKTNVTEKKYRLNFVLDKNVKVNQINDHKIILTNENAKVQMTSNMNLDTVRTKVSYSYGLIEDTIKVLVNCNEASENIITNFEVME